MELVRNSCKYLRLLLNAINKHLFFLSTDDITETMMEDISKGKRVYETKRKIKSGIMLSETKRILDNFYYPYLRKLHALTNDDRFLWQNK